MAKLTVTFVTIAAVMVASNAASRAADTDMGKSEYLASCATCHGADAKGKGPLSSELRVAPTDLTILAKKNNGVFPVKAIYEIIDGRQPVLGHGTRDMPIWGNRYTPSQIQQAIRGPLDLTYDPEFIVRTRILAIIDYLNRIQER